MFPFVSFLPLPSSRPAPWGLREDFSLSIANTSQFGGNLVDLRLPGITGYEVARHARADQRCRHVRLIALTGYGRSEDRRAVREAGFDEHLVKPVDPEDLMRAMSAEVS